MKEQWDKLIVALDLEDKERIKKIVNTLSPKGVKFKVGSIAFTKFGPEFIKELISEGKDIFLDLKLYDIPNTMKRTAAIITEMGCWAFTVHLEAGKEALGAVKNEVAETVDKLNKRKPLILGVSILTSLQATQKEVNNLVSLAQAVGLDGVIASAQEAEGIKKAGFTNLKVITPGIRNPNDNAEDQVRITTANSAFANGADYIVVGRPIITQNNYLEAAESILRG